MKAYIYVTKSKPYLFYQSFIYEKDFGKYVTSMIKPDESDEEPILNGKIAASFDLNVAEYIASYSSGLFFTSRMNQGELLGKSCLKYDELKSYLKKGIGYALHIDNLIIFGNPLTLADFGLKKAPQSYCYGTCKGERALVYSIHPEPSCNVLNGIKTLEIRKTCPKGIAIL